MNRTFAAGLFLGAAIVAGGLITADLIVSDPAAAAPFNATRTTLADAGFVVQFCVNRQPAVDGGVDDFLTSTMLVPEVRSLPDGGSRTVNTAITGAGCQLGAAALTAAEQFANGGAAVCARGNNDLEQ